MSLSQLEKMTKAELRNKLSQMGMSLDRNEHPKEYYINLYLEKFNAKHKITRGNTPFYTKGMLRKRERTKNDDDDSLYEEEEDENEDSKESNKNKLNLKKGNKKDDKNINYKISGIKFTRLIPIKTTHILKNENETVNIQQDDNINNDNYMYSNEEKGSGDNNEYNDNIKNKNHQCYSNLEETYNNKDNFDNKKDIKIELKSDKNNSDEIKKCENNIGQNDNNNDNNQKISFTFGAPKNQTIDDIHFLSKGPISFGCVPDKIEKKEKSPEKIENNLKIGKKSEKYENFIKKMENSIKNELEKRENNNSPKKVLLKWDTPRQKEFLCSSMENIDNSLNNSNEQKNFGQNEFPFDNQIDESNEVEMLKNHQKEKAKDILKNKSLISDEYKSPFSSDVGMGNKNTKFNDKKMDIDDNNNNMNNYQNKNDQENYYEKKDIPIQNNEKIYIYEESNSNNNSDNNLNKESSYNDRGNIYHDNNAIHNNEDIYIEDNNNEEEYEDNNIEYNNNDYQNKEYIDQPQINKLQRANHIIKDKFNIKRGVGEDETLLIKDNKINSQPKGILNKKELMKKYKKYIYLLPLSLLLLFGLIFLLRNNSGDEFNQNNNNIYIILSVIILLIILYLLITKIKKHKKYKQMAKEDKESLMNLLQEKNINKENLMNNSVLLTDFFKTRIQYHNIPPREYINHVFPYLKDLFKESGFVLNIEDENQNGKNNEYWKEL